MAQNILYISRDNYGQPADLIRSRGKLLPLMQGQYGQSIPLEIRSLDETVADLTGFDSITGHKRDPWGNVTEIVGTFTLADPDTAPQIIWVNAEEDAGTSGEFDFFLELSDGTQLLVTHPVKLLVKRDPAVNATPAPGLTGVTAAQKAVLTAFLVAAQAATGDQVFKFDGQGGGVNKNLRSGLDAWRSVATPADNTWNSVTWSPELGLFVAVASTGSGNRVMTSPDGINWTSRASAADNSWTSICWSPELGLLVAVASTGSGNRVMTSPDGINWTSRASAADNSWVSVCWSPELGLFVAVSTTGTNNRVMTSPDGVNWTIRTSAANNSWNSVTWSPELGLFVAVATSGSGNGIMTSPDGVDWMTRTPAADVAIRSVVWSPELDLFAAVASNGSNNRIMTSPDGINWTSRHSSTEIGWMSVAWSPDLGFAAVANSGSLARVMTSPDGIIWTTRVPTPEQGWLSICWSPELGLFVAVANSGIGFRVMVCNAA